MASLLLVPILQFAIHDDGTLAVLSPWHPQIIITQHLLDVADWRRVEVQGDEVTFRCTNGGATYVLDPPDMRETSAWRVGQMDGRLLRSARLLRSWP